MPPAGWSDRSGRGATSLTHCCPVVIGKALKVRVNKRFQNPQIGPNPYTDATCTNCPTNAVISMAAPPPNNKRRAGLIGGVPDKRALKIPDPINPIKVTATIKITRLEAEVPNIPKKGTSPPIKKLVAEAMPASKGCAAVSGRCPISSRKWASKGPAA